MNSSWSRYVLLIILLLAGVQTARATHYRAGDIFYEQLGPTTFRVTVVTYTKTGGQSELADRDSIQISWGDGTQSWHRRTNGLDSDGNGIPNGEIVGNEIRQNIYTGVHTYPGQNTYVVSFEDENRINGINNIQGGNSVFVRFFVADTIFGSLDYNLYGGNSTPILLNPPIDYANVLDTFYHNPNAFDPDGDSLAFSLIVPRQSEDVVVPAYVFLDDLFPGPTNNFTLDPKTGEILWAVPQPGHLGENNVAILIREYRDDIATGEPRLIGTAIRDMQIIVLNEPNDPPQIRALEDTCVYGGAEELIIGVEATDPDGDQVTLSANGGPFQISPSATFSQTTGNPAFGTFRWQPDCDAVRDQPYITVFKAEDDYIDVQGNPAPLVDLETWQVHVVPPPPDSLRGSILPGGSISLTWDSIYACESGSTFRFFSVWRKRGCDPGRSRCDMGLAGRGYEQIATDLTSYSFIDNDVDRGHEYSYRVLAHFLEQGLDTSFFFNEVLSVPSNEVCLALPLDLPVITNVSIDTTATGEGRVFVRWTKPKVDSSGNDGLDTLIDVPPYTFEAFHSEGFTVSTPNSAFQFTSATYAGLNDTSFVDSFRNTQANPHAYEVEFRSSTDTLGATSQASSIFLSIAAGDETLRLSWEENVPWINEEYTVFRWNPLTSTFDSLAVVQEPMYVDTGLINDSSYCYRIRSKGSYTLDALPTPLFNFSQRACGIPIDTIPPCPPILRVSNDCETIPNQQWTIDNFENRLQWNLVLPCAEDAERFELFFADSNSNVFTSIEVTTDTFFNHVLGRENLSGCYYVVAFDEKDNESRPSDTLCVDNCPFYELPNTFSPNGDGANDFFVPFPGYRFIDRIDIKIYNRWGNLLFETEDPDIGWDGTGLNGKDVEDGVYFYKGSYYIRTVTGTEERPLPSEDDGSGFIHLIRSR